MSKVISGLAVLGILLLIPAANVNANAIGKVLVSKGSAISISAVGLETPLAKGSEVFLHDIIITTEGSFLVIKMNDATKLTLRPDTRISLDNYNQERGNESATLGLIKGGLRTLTGNIGKKRPDSFLLKTPTSTIGIRGTDFIARLCEEGGSDNRCGNQCAVEEQRLSSFQKLDADIDNVNSAANSQTECKPTGAISEGLYIGLYDGQINADGKNGSVRLKAIGAARDEQGTPECLTEVPNFLTLDPYLSDDPESTVPEFVQSMGPENLFDRVDKLLTQGYSASAIFNNEIANGNTIYSIVGAASQADPAREIEFRLLADLMLPGLPDYACDCLPFEQQREWNEISYQALEPKSVEEVARVFFEENQHLARFDVNNNAHGLFPVQELAEIVDQQSLWYRILPVRDHPMPNAVFVSLYADKEEIIVDGNLGLVQDAVNRGDVLIPVIFHYYVDGTVPIGRYPTEISSNDVAKIFRSDGIEISPVPNWKVGDYHAVMSIEQIKDLVSLPEKDDIDPDLWAAIEADIKSNGFSFPIILTTDPGAPGIKLYNSVERVTVAEELGHQLVPLTLFEFPSRPVHTSQCRRLVGLFTDGLEFFAGRFFSGSPGGPSGDESLILLPPSPPPPPVSP